MKKILMVIFSVLTFSLYAEQLDFDQFQEKVLEAFPQVEYVSCDVWKEWKGNADAFIKFYEENGQCIIIEDKENVR